MLVYKSIDTRIVLKILLNLLRTMIANVRANFGKWSEIYVRSFIKYSCQVDLIMKKKSSMDAWDIKLPSTQLLVRSWILKVHGISHLRASMSEKKSRTPKAKIGFYLFWFFTVLFVSQLSSWEKCCVNVRRPPFCLLQRPADRRISLGIWAR